MNAGRDDAPRPEAVRTSFEGGGRGRRGTTGLEGVRGGYMREGMVRRRGLMSGGERLLVDLPETPTAGRTLAASPRTRCSGKANLMNELLAAARTTKTP